MRMGLYGWTTVAGKRYSVLALSALAVFLRGECCGSELRRIESGLKRAERTKMEFNWNKRRRCKQ